MRRFLALWALASWSGCRHAPPPDPHTPEGTLTLFAQSLSTGTPAIDQVADLHVAATSRVVYEAKDLQDNAGDVMNVETFRQHLADLEPKLVPGTLFAGVARLLGAGHCTRLGDTSVPPELQRVATVGASWPQAIVDADSDVARKLTRVVSGDYRCEPGLSFGVVFTRPVPDDGTLRVAYVGPARHR